MAIDTHQPTIDELLAESLAGLLTRKARLAYDLADVEGQMLRRSEESDDDEWRHRAKTKAHYLRRAVAAVNNVISIKVEQERSMWSNNDHGQSIVVAFNKMCRVWEAASILVEADEYDDVYWARLVLAVNEAREVYFAVSLDG